MILRIHPDNPQPRTVDSIARGLEDGEIYILPTDTVYAIVCLANQPRAINELYEIKGMSAKHHLSLLCRDLAMVSHHAHSLPNYLFRMIKTLTPGPYTFILRPNRMVDRRGSGKKRSVGVRIVAHPLIQALMEKLDIPLASTSVTIADEYATDPEVLEQIYGHRVSAVVDGGIRYHEYSTILDCTGDEVQLVRQGCGDISSLGLVGDTD